MVQVFTTHILFLCIMVHGNGYGLLYIGLLSAEISISIMQWRRIRIDLHYLLLFVEINYFPLFKMFRIGKGPEQLTDMAWNNNVSGLQWRVSYRLRHTSQQSTQRPGTRCVPCVQFSTYETSRYTAVYSEHIGYFTFQLSIESSNNNVLYTRSTQAESNDRV